MSREIKFKVWDLMSKRMKFTGIGINKGIISGDDVVIMQYTGLKDKNGVEVYEGDIVQAINEYDDEKTVYEIRWDCYCYPSFEFYPSMNDDMDRFSYYDYIFNMDISVIGNIYENPELLVD